MKASVRESATHDEIAVRSDAELMVQFEHVSKRYAHRTGRGSLRDAIPEVARRVLPPRISSGGSAPRETWAVRDVSFNVCRGDALGIVGHNGAGKSTILKLLAGVTAPTQGRVRVNGRLVALIELGAGFHPDLTGRENVYLNGSILGLKRSEIDSKLDGIVAFSELERFIDIQVKYYSTGMHARLGFSIAAHVEPEILLIDEVLSVGDHAFQEKCLRRMEDFRRSGIAIVFVSHNLDAISKLCSQGVLLEAGRAVMAGPIAEVSNTYLNMAYESGNDAARDGQAGDGWLTREMEIREVQLYDRDGRAAKSFGAGESTTLTVLARANAPVMEPVLAIEVRNPQGVVVYSTHSGLLGAPIGDLRVGEEVEVSFSMLLNLCRGVYTVHASVVRAGGDATMDRRENVATFELAGDDAASGIADLMARAKVRRA